MKYSLLLAVACVLVAGGRLTAAESGRELDQLRILQSDASPREKDAACARLKLVGTAQSVPALSALLRDEQLSHSARYALESMKAPEASKALLEALPHTSGLNQAGIIASLGLRREADAVSQVSACLAASDVPVATAAARALGRIGGPVSLKSLQSAVKNATGPVRDAIDEALLAIADQIRQENRPADAIKVFQSVYLGGQQEHTRAAGYRGVLLSSGRRAIAMLKAALVAEPGPAQSAALQLVHELSSPEVTAAVCEVLPKTPTPMQVALLGGLGQRGDSSAVATITALLPSTSTEVQIAALEALAVLGDGKVVEPITEIAARAGGTVQITARQALVQLRPKNVDPVMLSLLPRATPGMQSELARALGERGVTDAVPKLVHLTQQGQGTTASAACRALGSLAREADIPALVELVTGAHTQEKATEAAETLNAVMQRILKARGGVDASAVLRGLNSAPAEGRSALLSVCSGLVDPGIRDALRRGLKDSDTKVRAAFTRATCDTIDNDLLPDLLALTASGSDDNTRTLAARACVRLIKEDERSSISLPRKLEVLQQLLGRGLGTEATRAVLGGLAEVPDKQALALAEPFLQDPALQAEAGRAVIKIASTIPDTEAASTALRKVAAGVADAPARESALSALKAIEARLDFITSWKMAGPFRQDGKNYGALFDTVFPPEASGGQAGEWRLVPPCPDPKRPYSVDLLAALGGEQAVAYAKTWIYSEQETPAIAEIGSDDGIKVWLNEALVHAHNVARALTPGVDKANVTLKKGWNLLLVKVTQNNQGWEFSLRLTKPDGARLPDLRTDPNHVPGL